MKTGENNAKTIWNIWICFTARCASDCAFRATLNSRAIAAGVVPGRRRILSIDPIILVEMNRF